jgi:hypothetical protein
MLACFGLGLKSRKECAGMNYVKARQVMTRRKIRTLRNLKRGPPFTVWSATPGCEDLGFGKAANRSHGNMRIVSTAHVIPLLSGACIYLSPERDH